MQHNKGFLTVVADAKTRVRELSVDQVKAKIDNGESFILVDVREDDEWRAGRAKGAIHLGKGVIERDIETVIPDKNTPVILYCGGGFRSALAADMIQKMGYQNVISMDGGIKAWRLRGLPEDK